jgi:hypothetical protein
MFKLFRKKKVSEPVKCDICIKDVQFEEGYLLYSDEVTTGVPSVERRHRSDGRVDPYLIQRKGRAHGFKVSFIQGERSEPVVWGIKIWNRKKEQCFLLGCSNVLFQTTGNG